ncbi:AI-2E family transporter [soil metagenome]
MEISLPKYLKITIILLGVFLCLWFLQSFRPVFIPLAFAALFAFALLPLCNRLESVKVPRTIAIVICLLGLMAVLSLLIWFLSSQIMSLSRDMPNITEHFERLVGRLQDFLYFNFDIEPQNRQDLIRNSLGRLSETGTALMGSTIAITTDALTVLGLIPIYIFCMLYYRDHFRHFIFRFVHKDKRSSAMGTVDAIQRVIGSYLSGLMIVILIVAILNSVGLMIVGVSYPIFFGVFASILTIIPYIGILIGALLPALFVLAVTGSIVKPLIVIGIFTFVQFLEGNFITPYITGSKVSINPFAAILALIVGGHIWGAAGMVLAIPAIAVAKVLFDSYEPLEPFGFLLCDISAYTPPNQRRKHPILERIKNLARLNPKKP